MPGTRDSVFQSPGATMVTGPAVACTCAGVTAGSGAAASRAIQPAITAPATSRPTTTRTAATRPRRTGRCGHAGGVPWVRRGRQLRRAGARRGEMAIALSRLCRSSRCSARDERAEPAPDGRAEPARDERAEPAPDERAEPARDERAEPAPDERAEPARGEPEEPEPGALTPLAAREARCGPGRGRRAPKASPRRARAPSLRRPASRHQRAPRSRSAARRDGVAAG